LLDGSDSITDQDLSLLSYIIDKGRALVVAVNKWDSLDSKQRDEVREDLERKVEFLKFTRIHFISALQGSGVGDLFKSINKAYDSAFTDLSTPQLTRMLEVVVAQHQPPMVNGRRIKLRYAHQGGQNPPIIIIHGKQALKVPKSYQRYLMNHFTKALKLFGTPLRIEFRQDDNPFKETTRVKPVLDKEEARQKKIERRKRDRE
jgi:GTP-binding protein